MKARLKNQQKNRLFLRLSRANQGKVKRAALCLLGVRGEGQASVKADPEQGKEIV